MDSLVVRTRQETLDAVEAEIPDRATERNMRKTFSDFYLETVGEVYAWNACRDAVLKHLKSLRNNSGTP